MDKLSVGRAFGSVLDELNPLEHQIKLLKNGVKMTVGLPIQLKNFYKSQLRKKSRSKLLTSRNTFQFLPILRKW